MTRNKKITIGLGVGAAFTWFSSHCGSGFASGRQIMQYFGRHGWFSLFLPFFTWAIVGLSYYFALEFCRLKGLYNYKEFGQEFYCPRYGRVFVFLMDWVMILGNITGIASSIAAGGELTSSYTGLPYMACILLVMIIVVLTIAFGLKMVMNFSSVLGLIIIGVIMTVTIVGLRVDSGQTMMRAVAEQASETGFWEALKDSIVYAGMRMTTIGTLVVLVNGMTKRDVKMTVLLGAGINALAMAAVGMMMLNFYPLVTDEAIPVVAILRNNRLGGLEILYNLMLFCAVVTTALTLTLGLTARFVPYGENIIVKESTRRILYTSVIILLSLAISTFGLTNIVKTGYQLVGKFALVIFTIPWLILGPVRLRQLKQKIKK